MNNDPNPTDADDFEPITPHAPLPPRQPPKPPPRDRPVAPPAYYPTATPERSTTRIIALSVVATVIACAMLVVVGFGLYELAHWAGPGPGPAPIPAPSGPLRVIMVSDSSANMSKGQLDALGSTAVRGWLNAHCGKDSAGLPAWRSWDKDTDPSGEPEDWQKAWKALQPNLKSLPAVVIYEGGKGKVFALPDSEDGLMKLLSRYGGK